MPRYYLHLYNDIDVPDDEGVELPDLSAAVDYTRKSITVTAGETLKEQGRITLSHRIDIEDGSGQVLSTVMFSDVIKIEG